LSFLLVNDDGVDSPALLPFARALSGLGPVRCVVPDGERSWIGKAITRHHDIRVARVEKEGVELHTTSGYPADCTQLGVHQLFDEPPEMVISGINVGYNHGLAFFLSSGTVGAAAEGWVAGVPAVAFSLGVREGHRRWAEYAWSADSRELWERAAALACDVLRDIRTAGYPKGVDLLSVNFPADATLDTPRVVTRLAVVGYDNLFARVDEGVYRHEFGGAFRHVGTMEGSDLEAANAGQLSITPVRLAHSAEVPETFRDAVERVPG
jgi:5'-nucleotidase